MHPLVEQQRKRTDTSHHTESCHTPNGKTLENRCMDDVELYTCKAVRVSRILLHLHITNISLVSAASTEQRRSKKRPELQYPEASANAKHGTKQPCLELDHM